MQKSIRQLHARQAVSLSRGYLLSSESGAEASIRLKSEGLLLTEDSKLVFLVRICSINLPIRVVAFSLPLSGSGLAPPFDQAAIAVAGVR